MNKHQTLAYIKYGELINKINDIIADHDTKNDIYKFLSICPWIIKDPSYVFNYLNSDPEMNGNLVFSDGLYSNFRQINFDGNNNFRLNRSDQNKSDIKWTKPNWISIDDIEHYVDTHLDDFNDIIK